MNQTIKIMNCIRCQREIKSKENYIDLIEWNNGKLIKQNYCHKTCWDLMMNTKKTLSEAMSMARGLFGSLKQQGVIKEQVEIV